MKMTHSRKLNLHAPLLASALALGPSQLRVRRACCPLFYLCPSVGVGHAKLYQARPSTRQETSKLLALVVLLYSHLAGLLMIVGAVLLFCTLPCNALE